MHPRDAFPRNDGNHIDSESLKMIVSLVRNILRTEIPHPDDEKVEEAEDEEEEDRKIKTDQEHGKTFCFKPHEILLLIPYLSDKAVRPFITHNYHVSVESDPDIHHDIHLFKFGLHAATVRMAFNNYKKQIGLIYQQEFTKDVVQNFLKFLNLLEDTLLDENVKNNFQAIYRQFKLSNKMQNGKKLAIITTLPELAWIPWEAFHHEQDARLIDDIPVLRLVPSTRLRAERIHVTWQGVMNSNLGVTFIGIDPESIESQVNFVWNADLKDVPDNLHGMMLKSNEIEPTIHEITVDANNSSLIAAKPMANPILTFNMLCIQGTHEIHGIGTNSTPSIYFSMEDTMEGIFGSSLDRIRTRCDENSFFLLNACETALPADNPLAHGGIDNHGLAFRMAQWGVPAVGTTMPILGTYAAVFMKNLVNYLHHLPDPTCYSELPWIIHEAQRATNDTLIRMHGGTNPIFGRYAYAFFIPETTLNATLGIKTLFPEEVLRSMNSDYL